MIAALYVQTGGIYYGLDHVEPWDEKADARLYNGPWPVVAHPPCSRWCMLASVNEARWGAMIGHDEGTFAAALHAVRTYGGVLEHPAYTLAWERYDLPRPVRGYWSRSFTDQGWVTEVSQSAYGHAARKRTWLYYVGDHPLTMDWRDLPGERVVGAGINSGEAMGRGRLEKHEASATPVRFRDALIAMAESAAWARA